MRRRAAAQAQAARPRCVCLAWPRDDVRCLGLADSGRMTSEASAPGALVKTLMPEDTTLDPMEDPMGLPWSPMGPWAPWGPSDPLFRKTLCQNSNIYIFWAAQETGTRAWDQ